MYFYIITINLIKKNYRIISYPKETAAYTTRKFGVFSCHFLSFVGNAFYGFLWAGLNQNGSCRITLLSLINVRTFA